MQHKFNEATELRPQGDRLLEAPVVKADLAHFVNLLKDEKSWKEKDRNAITVFKATGMSILLIALQEGAVIPEYAVQDMVCIQVIEGSVVVKTQHQTTMVSAGQLLVLHHNVPHSVVAAAAAYFLLTVVAAEEKKDAKSTAGKTSGTSNEMLPDQVF